MLIQISKEKNPPVHLLLGVGTLEFLNNKIDILTKDAKKWESLTVSTAI
ncbi:hypothetical protein PYS58_10960 [Chryseobacterium indologenes]|nr:hypothetical protein [Chryseobacterium indologenes]WET51642.1 hypothetical protein PYS58_10960 [Chryseobacterium indologenes]